MVPTRPRSYAVLVFFKSDVVILCGIRGYVIMQFRFNAEDYSLSRCWFAWFFAVVVVVVLVFLMVCVVCRAMNETELESVEVRRRCVS